MIGAYLPLSSLAGEGAGGGVNQRPILNGFLMSMKPARFANHIGDGYPFTGRVKPAGHCGGVIRKPATQADGNRSVRT